jgi:hypothetical protein
MMMGLGERIGPNWKNKLRKMKKLRRKILDGLQMTLDGQILDIVFVVKDVPIALLKRSSVTRRIHDGRRLRYLKNETC